MPDTYPWLGFDFAARRHHRGQYPAMAGSGPALPDEALRIAMHDADQEYKAVA
jgi:hypothetical protein